MGRVDARTAAIALTVAVVLGDSSVVTIALPDILVRYDVEVVTVAWVLTAYNIVLALAAVPGAYLARRRPREVAIAGLLLFAASSVTCGLAASFGILVAARAVQAVGGALILGSALELLRARTGSRSRSVAIWGGAGIAGAALGPAVGGVMTQALGWESIFLAQAPLPILTLAAVSAIAPAVNAPAGRPHVAANGALLLVSAALSAALFLLAILLINGWRLEPAAAGAVLSVMPVAAIGAGYWANRRRSGSARAVPGAVLIVGGLAALALLPRAGWAWTLLPQVAIGAGLGLAVSALTEWAMHGRDEQSVHGGWTIGARHGGVVLGLLILTPLFSADLERNNDRALAAGTAAVIDSKIKPTEKLGVAQDVLAAIDGAQGRVPDVRPPLDRRAANAPNPDAYRALADRLEDELDRAATSAFGRSFWIAAGFGLLALIPLGLRLREVDP